MRVPVAGEFLRNQVAAQRRQPIGGPATMGSRTTGTGRRSR